MEALTEDARLSPARTVLEQRIAAAPASPHRVHITCDPTLQLTATERAVVDGVVDEALANAVRHAFLDGRVGDIWVRLAEVGGRLSLMVRDNGAGMPDLLDMTQGGRAIITALARARGGYARLGSANFGGAEVLAVFPRGD